MKRLLTGLFCVALLLFIPSTIVAQYCPVEAYVAITIPSGVPFSCNPLQNCKSATFNCSTGTSPTSSISVSLRPSFVSPISSAYHSSPIVIDLDGDGRKEIVISGGSGVAVLASNASGTITLTSNCGPPAIGCYQRVFSSMVLADLDGDGVPELVFAQQNYVSAYSYTDGTLKMKAGSWPFQVPGGSEIRALTSGDLDRDGKVEIVVALTTTSSGPFVYVINSQGSLFQPVISTNCSWETTGKCYSPSWPRFNNDSGPGGDANHNGLFWKDGVGSLKNTIAVGNIDSDSNLEVMVSEQFQFNVLKVDGYSIDTSMWYHQHNGQALTWGQMVYRWADETVEDAYYHSQGNTPNGNNVPLFNFGSNPPSIVDLDRDLLPEIGIVPSKEQWNTGITERYAVVFNGNASINAGRRASYFTQFNLTYVMCWNDSSPSVCRSNTYYPDPPPPAFVSVDILGDVHPEVIINGGDGYIYCLDYTGNMLWRWDYRHGIVGTAVEACEPIVADLDSDMIPEIAFVTSGKPGVANNAFLVVLSNDGGVRLDIPIPSGSPTSLGTGSPTLTVGDSDSDGHLELIVFTWDNQILIWDIIGSSLDCILRSESRGGLLRQGAPDFQFAGISCPITIPFAFVPVGRVSNVSIDLSLVQSIYPAVISSGAQWSFNIIGNSGVVNGLALNITQNVANQILHIGLIPASPTPSPSPTTTPPTSAPNSTNPTPIPSTTATPLPTLMPSPSPTSTPSTNSTLTSPPTVTPSLTPSSTPSITSTTFPPIPLIVTDVITINGTIFLPTTGSIEFKVSPNTSIPSGLLNVSGCATIEGDLKVDVSSAPITNGSLLLLIASDCLTFSGQIITVPEYDDSCIPLTGTPIQTDTGLSVLLTATNSDTCGSSSGLPRIAIICIIIGIVILIVAAGILLGAFLCKRRRRPWLKHPYNRSRSQDLGLSVETSK